jgi:hypothetical protein
VTSSCGLVFFFFAQRQPLPPVPPYVVTTLNSQHLVSEVVGCFLINYWNEDLLHRVIKMDNMELLKDILAEMNANQESQSKSQQRRHADKNEHQDGRQPGKNEIHSLCILV